MSAPKAFAILGPTAGGKTALALQIAEHLPVEIISLDSALVYRDMDIGTAKPTLEERSAAPHHLIDIISPLQSYSAAEFVRDCTRLVVEIHERGRLPLIVGGTMMYFHALTAGLNNLPEADAATRAALQADKAAYGLSYLYEKLKICDPDSASRLQPADSQRIERALEVFMLTGKPLSRHFAEQQQYTPPLDLHTIALIPENRALLHEQIGKRFDSMLAQGFLDEMQMLRGKYPELTADMPSMRCVGYRQAWDYLEGLENYADFVEKGKAATRQLAKRQLTWLRKIPLSASLDPYGGQDCFPTAEALLKQHFDV
ncbi:tRNA (adenosine(37)-N6)-dimethylallyltransferase MiaA [Neisseria animalis]|uniref:tRNA dimethylallyltransferase n=1 Tax=Neisseria animalis TaxID=492 RepID=A0A5P3MQL1_NEIAN|nr:tRNA (adenosine(37)-N6)-dimethylallyltransferase MiaA [Neisseria animalis]QEY23355.1 tRNA (adenosine(37)-N6)-dimethylallyltransferase MiaA [Neisseria animalis]ROW33203.1 tRNA (adenosine(37)-N6)-dimethylallyltransferase MiaA [Neisseria animalis]VEE08750.1 tRNA delta(2)-isopentenylpyrophosphate transferase [Neisseria animalis]